MASYKIYFLDFCYKNTHPTLTKCCQKLQNASVWAHFNEKASKRPLEHLHRARLQVWNNAKNVGDVVGWGSVGDEEAAVARIYPVLAHAHLVLDGDTANGATGAGERVEVGAAAGAHGIKVVGIY